MKAVAIAILALVLTCSVLADTTSAPLWITAISYEQRIAPDSSISVDVHIGLLQNGSAGFPCAASSVLTLDPLIMSSADIKSSSAATPNVNPLHLNPSSETGGYVYHLPVGPNLDLPIGWESASFKVSAHCTGSTKVQVSPVITVRRFATIDPLQASIVNGQPQWNRSGSQDTLAFAIQTDRAVAVPTLVVRDAENNNIVSNTYNDSIEATRHSVTLQATSPLKGLHRYKYDVQFSAGGLSIIPAQSLPWIDLPAVPTRDYDLVVVPTSDQLFVRDLNQDLSFAARTSDKGTLDVTFDTLQINGSNVVHESSADGITHSFKIPKNLLPSDGQYSFKFNGVRTDDGAKLVSSHESVLIVITKTLLGGPVGIGLQNGSIVVTYCLSRSVKNEVRISAANSPATFFVGADGKQESSGAATSCNKGGIQYTASLPLADFSTKVSAATPPASGAPKSTAKPGAAVPAASGESSTQLPIQLYIIDTSNAAEIVTTLNLSAVLLSHPDTKELGDSLNTLADKNSTSDSKTAATKTLKDKFGLDQPTIDSLTQISKKTKGASQTIATVLASIGKGLLSTYLGIPAVK